MTTPNPVDALMKLVDDYASYVRWHCERQHGSNGTNPEMKLAEVETARAAVEASASALAAMPAEPVEMSPEFTDTARAALLWVLWHHQGSSSKFGQPIRYALGMGQHEHLNDHQLSEAKRWGKLEPKPSKDEHPAPYRCLKPHCPPRCSGCNHAIPVTDRPRMLMVNLLDQLAFDELGLPFEEGDSLAVDAARAWLCEPPIAQQAGGVPAGSPIGYVNKQLLRDLRAGDALLIALVHPSEADQDDVALYLAAAPTPPAVPRVVDKAELKRLVSLVFGEEFQITRAVPAIKESLTVEPREPLSEEQIDAAAQKLAECMDYPWSHMPEKGRENMREHAKAVIEAGIVTPKEPQ